MQSRKMVRFYPARMAFLGFMFSTLSFVGCDRADSEPQSEARPATSSHPQPKANKQRRAATLAFDGKEYQFDFVMCAPGSQGTTMIVASDKANRSNYPMVRASIFPDQPPESVANTISLDFQNAEPRVLWLRHEARIEKTDFGLVANGKLHGQEMTIQPNGLQKPVPLTTDSIKSFSLDVKC